MDTTPSFLKRCAENPILSAADIPYDASLIFNAGVTKYNGKYVMAFRNDYGSKEEQWRECVAKKKDRMPPLKTSIGLALSDDGIHWTPGPKPVFVLESDEIFRAYDPRLTVVDGELLMCFAVDTRHGLRGGIARTDDFESFEILSLSAPDNRNMVLFPEKLDGKYLRLERPLPVYSRGGGEQFDIWFSDSPDLRYWGNTQLQCEDRSGGPPGEDSGRVADNLPCRPDRRRRTRFVAHRMAQKISRGTHASGSEGSLKGDRNGRVPPDRAGNSL